MKMMQKKSEYNPITGHRDRVLQKKLRFPKNDQNVAILTDFTVWFEKFLTVNNKKSDFPTDFTVIRSFFLKDSISTTSDRIVLRFFLHHLHG